MEVRKRQSKETELLLDEVGSYYHGLMSIVEQDLVVQEIVDTAAMSEFYFDMALLLVGLSLTMAYHLCLIHML